MTESQSLLCGGSQRQNELCFSFLLNKFSRSHFYQYNEKPSMKPCIRFSNVSKYFRIQQSHPRSWQEHLVSMFRRSGDPTDEQSFWVLKDINLEIYPSETVSIIGSNGAGKSTMLKLLTHIVRPTHGTIEINGRISALLELGAGFHPDLTGRENIYLNGAILGLSRQELQHKLDEIIDFAEMERFLDVPVRNYSSGMYVRLGFAVAVYTNPEILIVDEVLAVGDQVFQQKCLDRIYSLKQKGVTIILVTHSLSDVGKLCERAVWLKDGSIEVDGRAIDVIDQYSSFFKKYFYEQQAEETTTSENSPDKNSDHVTPTEKNRWGSYEAEITQVELLDAQGSTPLYFETGSSLKIRIHYKTDIYIEKPAFGLSFYRRDGVQVNGPNSIQAGCDITFIEGSGYVDYHIESLPLNAGHYELTAAIYKTDLVTPYDHHHRLYSFEVYSSTSRSEGGIVHIPANWQYIPQL